MSACPSICLSARLFRLPNLYISFLPILLSSPLPSLFSSAPPSPLPLIPLSPFFQNDCRRPSTVLLGLFLNYWKGISTSWTTFSLMSLAKSLASPYQVPAKSPGGAAVFVCMFVCFFGVVQNSFMSIKLFFLVQTTDSFMHFLFIYLLLALVRSPAQKENILELGKKKWIDDRRVDVLKALWNRIA